MYKSLINFKYKTFEMFSKNVNDFICVKLNFEILTVLHISHVIKIKLKKFQKHIDFIIHFNCFTKF